MFELFSRAHSIPRATEFRGEQRDVPFAVEFPHSVKFRLRII